MKYDSHDEYINNPLSSEEIQHIQDSLGRTREKIKKHYRNILLCLSILLTISFYTSVYLCITESEVIYSLISISITLFILLKMVGYNTHNFEIKKNKNLPDSCKVEIKMDNGEYYDYISSSAGYQLSGIYNRLEGNKKVDEYHYPKDIETLSSNIQGREMLNFEYGIVSDKYKIVRYKHLMWF